MKRTQKSLGLIFLSLLTVSISGQTVSDCPKVAFRRAKISKIQNLNSYLKTDESCRIQTFSGKITSLNYDDDSTAEAISLTLELPDKRRVEIMLDDEAADCFSEVEKAAFRAQLKKGANVRVKVYCCGQTANCDFRILSIEFLLKQ